MSHLSIFTIAALLIPLVAHLAAQGLDGIHGPVKVHDRRCRPVLLDDGRIFAMFMESVGDGRKAVAMRISADHGRNWGESRIVYELPKTGGDDPWADLAPLCASDRALHVFMLKWENKGKRFPERKLGAWHIMSGPPYDTWTEPKQVFDGYIGALMSTAQLANGTIILPFAYLTDRSWRKEAEGLEGYVYMGQHTATAVYSQDGGKTFRKSPSDLNVPTPDLGTYGAVEPVCLPLKDGRGWMLIRTQLGRQWESFSNDGVRWSEPRPSRFISSDSPVSLTRLRDGRIVIIWNNCLRYPYAYGGRHVLHAAISKDDGKTWHGFREVFRDPHRKEPAHPIRGDYGTAYSFTAPTQDGKLLFSTGQGPTAGVFLLHPDWLMATKQQDDFSDGLEGWSVFGTRGVALIDRPDGRGAKALKVERIDQDFPAGAVWSFPNGQQGEMRVRLQLLAGSAETVVSLTDHFSSPFDKEAELHALFALRLMPGLRLPNGDPLRTGTSYVLELRWSFADRNCAVSVDGAHWQNLPQQKLISEGANYLRFRVASDEPADGGLLIESVSVESRPGSSRST